MYVMHKIYIYIHNILNKHMYLIYYVNLFGIKEMTH